MQIWKWLLVLGILFLITYNPSTRTMSKYFDDPRLDTGNVIPAEGTPQGDRGSSDDNQRQALYAHRARQAL